MRSAVVAGVDTVVIGMNDPQGSNNLQLLDKIPSPIWRSAPDGNCIFFNGAWLNFTGRSQDQESGRGWIDGVHPDDLPRVQETYLRSHEHQRPFQLDFRVRHHSGEYRWISTSAEPVQDEDGRFAGFLGTCLDLTERREMERSLAHSERMFEQLFEYNPDGVIVVDHEMKILTANRQAYEMFGYTPGELLGKSINTLMPPEFRRRHNRHFIHYLKQPHLRAMGAHLSLWALRKDGSRFPIAITLGPFEDLSAPGRHLILATMRDQTSQVSAENALRESEARFHTIFNEADLGIELLDLSGRVVESNPAFSRILGYSAEELRQMNHLEFTHPEDAVLNKRLVDDLVGGRRERIQFEKRYLHKDGHVVWGRVSLSLYRGEDGAPEYILGLVDDITADKQIRAELAEVQRRLMDSSEAERLHLAQELHDGPLQDLQGIMFQLALVRQNLAGSPEEEDLTKIKDGLQEVIRSLRTISGELRPPALAPFGLEKAIRSYVEQIREQAPHLEIETRLMVDGRMLPERVRLALYRICQHLLVNVVRHSRAGHAFVRFAFDEKQITLEVSDDGCGFVVPHRWVELVRSGHFGLVGAIERAQAIGGELQVESSPGQGTSIRVVVPRQETYAAPEEKLTFIR